jgi:hypothetical protein
VPEITKVTIRGAQVPVSVDETGTFLANLAGTVYTSDSLDGLRDKLMNESRKAAAGIAIPFTHHYDGKIRRGVATGFHASRRVVLVRWESGQAGDLSGYAGIVLKPLSAAEEKQLRGLIDAVKTTNDALKAFNMLHQLDVRDAVQRAIAAALNAPADA